MPQLTGETPPPSNINDLNLSVRKIADLVLAAQRAHNDSYIEKVGKHAIPLDMACRIVCVEAGVPAFGPFLYFSQHWWNDVQQWADNPWAYEDDDFVHAIGDLSEVANGIQD
jgi:hypothetical protein